MRFIEIDGKSMFPTLDHGHLVITRKIKRDELKRGLLVTFQIENKLIIKRLVGLPSEHLVIENGRIDINSKPLKEPYLVSERERRGRYKWELGDNEVILLGDYGIDSLDSRQLGPISLSKIADRAVFRFWPPRIF